MSSKEISFGTVTPIAAVNAIWECWESKPFLHSHTQSRLYRALFCDIAQSFPNFVLNDFSHLLSRYEKEGALFYLKALPELGKAFETSIISMERFILPHGWKSMKGTRLPKFCYQLFTELIDDSGVPKCTLGYHTRDNQHIQACRFLRQVCSMWSKVEPESDAEGTALYTPRLTREAYDAFTKRVCASKEIKLPSSILCEARRLLSLVLEGNESFHLSEHDELRDFEKSPWGRHGPGAVAGKEVGCEKWLFNAWPGIPSSLFNWSGEVDWVEPQSLDAQPNARLCAVPKDFRGPRLICIEPKENQFVQQGLMDILYRLVEAHPLTQRSISFTDVAESRRLCYNYNFATIDMKDASDNISLALARLLLPRWFFCLVTRYRSREVTIPGGQHVKTRCLATMGNATCFPLETLIFWAIAKSTMILIKDSWRKSGRELVLTTRVFGDDIIVPLWAADSVCIALEQCGLPVNSAKTCLFTVIRESCGEWVCSGESVRIFKFRATSVTDHRSWLQWTSLLKDLSQTAMPAMQLECREIIAEFLGEPRKRFNKKLQRLEVLLPKTVHPRKTTGLVDYVGLYASFVHNDRTPSPRGARKRVKLGWQDARITG